MTAFHDDTVKLLCTVRTVRTEITFPTFFWWLLTVCTVYWCTPCRKVLSCTVAAKKCEEVEVLPTPHEEEEEEEGGRFYFSTRSCAGSLSTDAFLNTSCAVCACRSLLQDLEKCLAFRTKDAEEVRKERKL